MTNIVQFPATEPPAPQQINYAPMPSWVTACPPLNRAIMDLQKNGWQVIPSFSGEITCKHPRLNTRKPMNLSEAQHIDRYLEGRLA